MRVVKCPNCGAQVSNSPSNGRQVCEYCNSSLVNEEPIVKVVETSNQGEYYKDDVEPRKYRSYEPRPRISMFLAVVLCWINIFVGLVYIGIMKHKQHEWDKNNY